jgi:chromosomal replication initiator protein
MLVPNDSVSVIALQTPRIRKRSLLLAVGYIPLLDSLLLGPENARIHELLSAESIRELTSRTPIFIYGPSGTGKTAVAVTLATRWINDAPSRTYTMIHANDFSKSLARSIDADDMHRFRSQFRECDCLVVDAVQELAGKPAAQDELTESIDQVQHRGGLVVITSSLLPQLLQPWKEALASRMIGGYSVEMSFPSKTTRLEILKRLAQFQDIEIPFDELSVLNDQLTDNQSAIQLRGILSRWQHHKKATEPTSRTPPKILERLAEIHAPNTPTPNDIAKAVAKELHLTLESLRGPSRKSNVVRGRGLAMFLIRKWTDTSYQGIGLLFGNRDHTTVMHACKKTEDDLKADHDLSQSMERIRQKFV